jgi:hypothetical protein
MLTMAIGDQPCAEGAPICTGLPIATIGDMFWPAPYF